MLITNHQLLARDKSHFGIYPVGGTNFFAVLAHVKVCGGDTEEVQNFLRVGEICSPLEGLGSVGFVSWSKQVRQPGAYTSPRRVRERVRETAPGYA